VLALVIVPGLLMVSTFRFYSFKTLDLQSRRAYPVLALLALGLALLIPHENHACRDRVRVSNFGGQSRGHGPRPPGVGTNEITREEEHEGQQRPQDLDLRGSRVLVSLLRRRT
jgi:hypothetical protein